MLLYTSSLSVYDRVDSQIGSPSGLVIQKLQTYCLPVFHLVAHAVSFAALWQKLDLLPTRRH
jgi:hypothetical protein